MVIVKLKILIKNGKTSKKIKQTRQIQQQQDIQSVQQMFWTYSVDVQY
jgi:hypothetical protein